MFIVITGASKGIGKAILKKYAADADAHHFFICARNASALEQTRSEVQERFPKAIIHVKACDIGDKEEAKGFGGWILSHTSQIDILVNNAGPFVPGNVSDEEEGALELMMNAHLFGAYHLTRTLLPAMIGRRSGYIINMCSIASLQAYPNGGAYSIAKFALAGFTKNLRHEMKPHGIKVIGVYPGAAYTDSWSGSGVDPSRIMQAEDIASMIYSATQLSPQACVEDLVLRPQLGDL
jgi:short-subunit dehydrogenase